MTRKCKQCGDEFEPRNPRQQFCVGKACRQTWHRENRTRSHGFDQHVPQPDSRPQFEFIHAMQRDDSMFIDCGGNKKKQKGKVRSLHDYADRYGIRIITRSEGTGFRCWRDFDSHE